MSCVVQQGNPEQSHRPTRSSLHIKISNVLCDAKGQPQTGPLDGGPLYTFKNKKKKKKTKITHYIIIYTFKIHIKYIKNNIYI